MNSILVRPARSGDLEIGCRPGFDPIFAAIGPHPVASSDGDALREILVARRRHPTLFGQHLKRRGFPVGFTDQRHDCTPLTHRWAGRGHASVRPN